MFGIDIIGIKNPSPAAKILMCTGIFLGVILGLVVCMLPGIVMLTLMAAQIIPFDETTFAYSLVRIPLGYFFFVLPIGMSFLLARCVNAVNDNLTHECTEGEAS